MEQVVVSVDGMSFKELGFENEEVNDGHRVPRTKQK